MKYGFVRARALSPDLKPGDPAYNAQKLKEGMERAAVEGVELLVFPELCVTGYTCGDLFGQKLLLNAAEEALKELVSASEGKHMLVFAGVPVAVGAELFNCAAAFAEGKLLALIPKSHIPNYREFYELRNFTPAKEGVSVVDYAGCSVPFGREIVLYHEKMPAFSVAAEICEDLWAAHSPAEGHAAAGANIIVNLSASNEAVGKLEYRRLLVKAQSGKCVAGYVYADAGEGESVSDLIFAGHDMIAENGSLLSESAPFLGGSATGEIDVELLEHERRAMNTFAGGGEGYTKVSFTFPLAEGKLTRKVDPTPFVPEGKELDRRCGLILSMQSSALARRLQHTHSKTAVIGISGGLDSALALLVTVRAFDLLGKSREDIIAVTMPGFGTTNKTRMSGLSLMQATGVTIRTVHIGPAVNRHFKDIEHDPEDRNVTYENAQARMRTLILMDIANDTNGIVVGTGDLSELALGWCTYNGDHMSMYAVNCSVPKTLVKSLVDYEGRRAGGRLEAVLRGILNTEISPELLPPDEEGGIAQKTEDIVGPYELHDFYLYSFVRRGFSPAKTLWLAEQAFEGKYDRETLKKWLLNFYKRFFAQQFKRNCVPDGVKVGSVSLSPRGDWRMPSDASAALWLKEAEEL